MSAFKIGDVVKLKSGGPLMTVVKVNGEDVDVRWFNSDGVASTVWSTWTPGSATFPADTLTMAKG